MRMPIYEHILTSSYHHFIVIISFIHICLATLSATLSQWPCTLLQLLAVWLYIKNQKWFIDNELLFLLLFDSCVRGTPLKETSENRDGVMNTFHLMHFIIIVGILILGKTRTHMIKSFKMKHLPPPLASNKHTHTHAQANSRVNDCWAERPFHFAPCIHSSSNNWEKKQKNILIISVPFILLINQICSPFPESFLNCLSFWSFQWASNDATVNNH